MTGMGLRFGTFRVSLELEQDWDPEPLLGQCEVVNKTFDPLLNETLYLATCDQFDELADDEPVPAYTWLCTAEYNSQGEKVSVSCVARRVMT